MNSKEKNILFFLPSNQTYKINQTLKIIDLKILIEKIENLNETLNEKITITFITNKGEKPYLNYEKSESINDWIKNNELKINSCENLEEIKDINLYDGILIPSFINILQYIKTEISKNLINLIKKFQDKKKIIVTYEHSVLFLCKVNNENNFWPFLNYNLTGSSISNSLIDELYEIGENCEEEISLKGGNYISKDNFETFDNNNYNNSLVICDKNIITGYDSSKETLNTIILCLIEKIKFLNYK